MKDKEISGSVQPDKTGIQFIYLDDGRLRSSAEIVGNITEEKMLDMFSTAEGFRRLVHSIGVSVETEDSGKQAMASVKLYLNDGFTAPEPEEEEHVDFETPHY